MKCRKANLSSSISTLVLLLTVGATGAAAQSAPGGNTAQESTDDSGVTLGDIVVTAQKREESLQEVPLAVSALNSQMLEARGISSTEALSTSVPGLQLPRIFGAQLPFIRGIGSINSATGDESANAIFIDGVYRPSQPGGIFNFNAVERIEVLKGPQGTLFGRNALGGVINIITRNPTQDFSFDAEVGYGNYQTFEGSMRVNGGLTENLAASFSVYYQHQNDGWGKNLFDGSDAYKGKEFSARAKLRWESADGDTSVTAAADYDNFYANTGYIFTAVDDAVLLDGSTSQGFYNVNTNITDPVAKTEQYGADLTINHDLGAARVVSITSYREVNPVLRNDQEGTRFPIVDILQVNPRHTFTQELQLLSASTSKISWVAGLYYYDDVHTNKELHLSGAAFAPLPYIDIPNRLSSKSYAAFGQVTVPILTSTNLTGGLRFTRDIRGVRGAVFAPPGFIPGDIVPGSAADAKAKFNKLTWKAVLDHHWTENVMTYASYSRGFKSGLFNGVTPADPAVRPSTLDAYEIGAKTELLDRRLRLNVAGFYYKYDDIQLTVLQVGRNVLLNAAKSTVKGFDVEMEAAVTREFRLQAAMTYLHGRFGDFPGAIGNRPRVDAQGVPLGGNELYQILDKNGANNGRGLVVPFAPSLTANIGAQYLLETGMGNFTLAANAAYNSGPYRDPDNRLKDPNYTIVNASLSWESVGGRYSAKLWAKNLLDEKYYSYATASGVGDIGSAAAPLTYGASVGVHF